MIFDRSGHPPTGTNLVVYTNVEHNDCWDRIPTLPNDPAVTSRTIQYVVVAPVGIPFHMLFAHSWLCYILQRYT